MKEPKVNEVFELNGKRYKCVEGNGCENCAGIYNDKSQCSKFPNCVWWSREDKASVIFKEVGEDSKEEIIKMLANSLIILVELKDLKDKYGKTKDYLEQQPKAWELARLALKKINKEE